MKVTIYKCDICGKTLSDKSVNPKIEIPHIHIIGKAFRLAKCETNVIGADSWTDKHLYFSKEQKQEYQYCIDCFLNKIHELKDAKN